MLFDFIPSEAIIQEDIGKYSWFNKGALGDEEADYIDDSWRVSVWGNWL
jgi:hypothetical protein